MSSTTRLIGSARPPRRSRLATPLAVLPLLLSACTDHPLPLQPADQSLDLAAANAAASTVRSGKGDLVTGDAATFAAALKEIGPQGEVLVWLKETGTPRPSAEFLINLPGSATETIALAAEAPGVQRRNTLGPASVRGASVDAVVRALTQSGVAEVERMDALPVLVVRLADGDRRGALNALLRHPNVDYVSAVRARPVEFTAAPVGANPIDSKHTLHSVPQAWDLTRGSGARIGIMDSGLARSAATGLFHEDARYFGSYGVLAYGFVDDECGSSTANQGSCTPYDDNIHGTAMVGLAGGNDNNIGYVGMAPFATTYSMKIAWNTHIQGHCRDNVFSNTTFCLEDDDFIRAVNWAASRRLHVLSMSFTTNLGSDAYRALATARNSYGVFLVAATGNTVGGSPQEPASFDVVMGIAGVDAAGNNMYSTAARVVSGFAGGATNIATCYQNYYCDAGSPSLFGSTGGTSAATANVAGIVGLIRAYHPNETVAQVWNRLVATATGPNRVVNAYAAMTYVPPLTATITGPTTLQTYGEGYWSASAANGTAPYTYAWTRNGTAVGTGPTYSDYAMGTSFSLAVTVTDAVGRTATRSIFVNVSSGAECGTPLRPQICHLQ